MTAAPSTRDQGSRRRGRMRLEPATLSAAVALIAATAVVTWLVSDGSTRTVTTTVTSSSRVVVSIGPVAASAGALTDFAKVLQQPVYWAGPKAGYRYELTENSKGDVYVRYLPHGVKAGDPSAAFLTIATFPFPDAVAALKAISKGKGSKLANGAFVLPDRSNPKNVRLAFPGVPYQIEVYDPSPSTAKAVATSGRVRSAG